jgi:GTP-binding protein
VQELVGNVALRMFDTDRPDAWEVHARGEFQLAVLVEQMRREGFELTVGKPIVLTREIDGKTHEPTERVTIDTPDEFVGAITQLLASRKVEWKTWLPRNRLVSFGLHNPSTRIDRFQN